MAIPPTPTNAIMRLVHEYGQWCVVAAQEDTQLAHDRCVELREQILESTGHDLSDGMVDVIATAFETDGTGCAHDEGEPACFHCLATIALRTIREGRAV